MAMPPAYASEALDTVAASGSAVPHDCALNCDPAASSAASPRPETCTSEFDPLRVTIGVAAQSTSKVNPDAVPVCARSKWISTRSPASSTPAGIAQLPMLAIEVPVTGSPAPLHSTSGAG